MKPRNIGLLLLAVFLACAPIVNSGAVESTITIQPSIADTWVNSMYLHTKYPEDPHGYLWGLFSGNMYVEYDSYKLYGSSRIYIKFNISSIPRDATVLSANMCLYMYDPPRTSQEFEAYKVLSDWDQHKLIWKTQPPTVQTPTSTATINPTPKEAWICWGVTDDLRMWHSGSAENYGMMMKIKNEINASDQLASFYPREGNQPADLKPKLVIKVDWHTPLTTTSSPTLTPKETPNQTPMPTSPTTTMMPTSIYTTKEPLKPQQNSNLLTLVVILILASIAGGTMLVLRKSLRRKASSKRGLVSGRSKKRQIKGKKS